MINKTMVALIAATALVSTACNQPSVTDTAANYYVVEAKYTPWIKGTIGTPTRCPGDGKTHTIVIQKYRNEDNIGRKQVKVGGPEHKCVTAAKASTVGLGSRWNG